VLTLIRREIRDQLLYIALPCFFSVVMICIAAVSSWWGVPAPISLALTANLMTGLFLGLCCLGTVQMHADRAGRISVLLSTLAVTRGQIFLARVLVGVLTLLIAVIPLVITALVLPGQIIPRVSSYHHVLAAVSVTISLAGFACYSIGLLVGWRTSRAWMLIGSILLLALVASLVWIKGFGVDAMAVLLLLIAAALFRAGSQFVSTSL
jgi:lysylphosphatidylglycerol synthetase-like protein (DUF2156 family)